MTRTWPLPRTLGGPRLRPTFFLRQHAGIDRRRRLQIHARRDEALRRVASIDAQLDRLSAERVQLLDELEAVRDTLWPAMPHWKCRRPPALDRPPLPPAPAGATVSRAGDLRTLCLVLLGRNGPLSLPDLHALLHRYGHVIDGDNPVKALADALRYEVRKGRAVRVARGVYDLDPELRSSGLPHGPDPSSLGEPLPWEGPRATSSADHDAGAVCGPSPDWSATPADQRERTDPGRWGGDAWPGDIAEDPTPEDPTPEGNTPEGNTPAAPSADAPTPAPRPTSYGTDSVPNRSRTAEGGTPGGGRVQDTGAGDVEDRPPP